MELGAHSELLSSVTSAGHLLPEGAAAGGRPVKERLAELRTEWEEVGGRLAKLQAEMVAVEESESDEEVRRGLRDGWVDAGREWFLGRG